MGNTRIGHVALAACAGVAIASCGAGTSPGRGRDGGYHVVHLVRAGGVNRRAIAAARPLVLADSDAGQSVSTISLVDGHRVSVLRFGRAGHRELVGPASWAPNGRTFVVSVGNSSYGQVGRVVLVRPGTRRRIAVRASVFRPAPQAIAFSPDGHYLIVPGVADYRPEGLYAYDLRSGRTTQLLVGPVGIGTNLSWSSDGRRIAFSRDPGDGGGVHILDLATRKVSLLTRDGVDPAWSPDGGEVAFVSNRGGAGRSCTEDGCQPSGEIDVIRADGSRRRRLTHTRADESRPAWSADGAQLAAQVTSGDAGSAAAGVVVFRADGSCYRIIVPPTDGNEYHLGSNALRPSRAPLPGSC